MTVLDEKLEPCPFCGATPELRDTLPAGILWFRCEKCDAETGGGKSRAEAIAAWNHRASPSQVERIAPDVMEAAKAAFRMAQSVYRADHDHFPLTSTWESTDKSVRDGWHKIAEACLQTAGARAIDENAIADAIAPYFMEGFTARDAAHAVVAALASIAPHQGGEGA